MIRCFCGSQDEHRKTRETHTHTHAHTRTESYESNANEAEWSENEWVIDDVSFPFFSLRETSARFTDDEWEARNVCESEKWKTMGQIYLILNITDVTVIATGVGVGGGRYRIRQRVNEGGGGRRRKWSPRDPIKKEISLIPFSLLLLPLVSFLGRVWFVGCCCKKMLVAAFSPPSVRSVPSHASRIYRGWCCAPRLCTRCWSIHRLKINNRVVPSSNFSYSRLIGVRIHIYKTYI